jgi:hypothetical protein
MRALGIERLANSRIDAFPELLLIGLVTFGVLAFRGAEGRFPFLSHEIIRPTLARPPADRTLGLGRVGRPARGLVGRPRLTAGHASVRRQALMFGSGAL